MMTLDQLADFIALKKTEGVPGDTPVAIEWDDGLSELDRYRIENGVLIFDCNSYGTFKRD